MLAVPESDTARVQEVHLTILHVLCDEIERASPGRVGAGRLQASGCRHAGHEMVSVDLSGV